MHSGFKRCSLLALAMGLGGCGGPNEYTPPPGIAAADLFAAACQSCHGEGGQGKFGFLLKIAGTDTADADIATHIREGGFIMPAFPNIGEPERQALVAYIKGK